MVEGGGGRGVGEAVEMGGGSEGGRREEGESTFIEMGAGGGATGSEGRGASTAMAEEADGGCKGERAERAAEAATAARECEGAGGRGGDVGGWRAGRGEGKAEEGGMGR